MWELRRFDDCILEAGVQEIPSPVNFTWDNHQDGSVLIMGKIDRGFGNIDWFMRFPNACFFCPPPGISDHVREVP